jgi:hypothetical protein
MKTKTRHTPWSDDAGDNKISDLCQGKRTDFGILFSSIKNKTTQ